MPSALYIRNVRANMSALKKGKVSFARISKMIRGKHSPYDTDGIILIVNTRRMNSLMGHSPRKSEARGGGPPQSSKGIRIVIMLYNLD